MFKLLVEYISLDYGSFMPYGKWFHNMDPTVQKGRSPRDLGFNLVVGIRSEHENTGASLSMHLNTSRWMGHVVLAAITGTTTMVPYL